MKFRFCSDIHADFWKTSKDLDYILPPMEDDKNMVIVVAGDLSTSKDIIFPLRMLSRRFKHVVYCLGNHDYYKSTIDRTLEFNRQIPKELPNVHLLERNSFEIDGVTFAGGTLWTDFGLFNTPAVSGQLAEFTMNDYRKIRREDFSKLRAVDTRRICLDTISYLKSLKDKEKLVIVTHHAPSPKAIRSEWKNNSSSPAYASNLEDVIREIKPRLWLFGHLHNSARFMVGETEVRANCYGYYQYEENGMYKDNLIIDTDEEVCY